MDETNLIDLNNTKWEKEHKLPSPLIPMPKTITTQPLISNMLNNPFDDVLYRTNDNKDPFDCNLETTPVFKISNSVENKENIAHLISPLYTPARPKKSLKVSSKPLYILETNPTPDSTPNCTLQFSDDSLQILSDSWLDLGDDQSSLNNLTLTGENNCDLDEIRRQSLTRQKVLNELESNESISPRIVLDDLNENTNTVVKTPTSLTPRKPINEFKSKTPDFVSKLKARRFNNSFSGVGFNGKIAQCKNLDSNFNESIKIEANRLAEIFQMSAPIILDDDINCGTPPWDEEHMEFPELDEADIIKDTEIVEEKKGCTAHEEEKLKLDINNDKEEILNNSASELTEQKSPTIITSSNKLGSKLQRSKSDSKVHQKFKSFITKPEKIQPIVPVVVPTISAGNLKVKPEKEKLGIKGPLKALIPLNKMAKIKNSILKPLKPITPPKNSQQPKKAVTPESKIKSPMAQSTPNVYFQPGTKDSTPRQTFGFPVSPVNRPSLLNELSSKLPSPRPKLNNSSIPSISNLTRRNSSGDISQSSRSSLNRSYEKSSNNNISSKLKRSTSFQTKTSTNTATTNLPTQNTQTPSDTLEKFVRKFGKPGKIKTLKFTPKI